MNGQSARSTLVRRLIRSFWLSYAPARTRTAQFPIAPTKIG